MAFDPTQADWIAANHLWLAHAKWRRWFRWFIVAVAILVLVNVILFVAVQPDALLDDAREAAVPMVVLIAVTSAYFVTPLTIARGVRTQFAQSRTMGESTTVEWDDERLTLFNSSGSTTVRWPDLHRRLEDQTVFVFLLTDRMMLMVPKRIMTEVAIADLAGTAVQFGPQAR